MNFILIYFSGTGNTELVTEKIAEALRKKSNRVTTLSIEEFKEKAPVLPEKFVLGLGFPVYKLTYPEIIDKFGPLLKIEDGRQMPFFAYSTYCRFSACSLHKAALLMESINYIPIALQSFKCPSNGIASLKDPASADFKSVMYFENGIHNKITEFSDMLIGNAASYFQSSDESPFRIAHHGRTADDLRISTAGKIENARYPYLSIDDKKCRKCGLCEKKCPVNNFVKVNGSITITDPIGCLHCLRCLHLCPGRAISFGPLVEGPERYTAAVRAQLFGEAEKRTDKEPGTMPVRLRWAMGNINFWIRSEIKRKFATRKIF